MMLTTKIIPVSERKSLEPIEQAVEILRRGGLVAFPTETVYGLGADAFNEQAVRKVFEAKGRPADNPMIVHIADMHHLDEIGKNISAHARDLAERYWPGPVTLVVEHRGTLPSIVRGGLPTVAVRMPNHPVTLKLIQMFSRGIVGPSANTSGKPSPTRAQHVYDDLHGKIDLILDAGPTSLGIESTVVDVTSEPWTILRLGGLPLEDIEAIGGKVTTTASRELLRRSPGTRHRHYAPQARVELIPEGNVKLYLRAVDDCKTRRQTVGSIVHSKTFLDAHSLGTEKIVFLSIDEYAHRIFDALRRFDQDGIDVILIEEIPSVGIGAAVMDRLRRAAEKK